MFFVEKDVFEDRGTAPKHLTRRDLRHKPLKSEINLLPNPAIKGFPSQRRKTGRTRTSGRTGASIADVKLVEGDSSSGDEEVARSASHRTISEQYSDRLVARRREHPDKATTHMASMDIWSEGRP